MKKGENMKRTEITGIIRDCGKLVATCSHCGRTVAVEAKEGKNGV
jgi:hypothetical protein